MKYEDLERLRSFVDKALKRGWTPCNQLIEGVYVINDPPCIRIAVASPSRGIDNDLYIDWLAPLHERELAFAVWGDKLIERQVAWRYRQHKLLDLLQTAGTHSYFEYLDEDSD